MRNYIILNDVNSNTINGLLIQELPPISKPKMRTQIEEIDGRAGDIVTQLGYAAYTKTISIGLYGDFDIDEVISYFNSAGTVVFSNEPDKYYNYEIIDQIDFNRLVRFRTAKVKMHVQPFKYPTEEEPLVAQYQYVTNTGSNMSLNNTADALFNKFDLLGNTEQTQYTGKNKLQYTLDSIKSINTGGTWNNNVYTWNGITYTINDDLSIKVNGTATAASYLILNNSLSLTSGTEYILNGCPSGGNVSTYALRIYTGSSYESEVGTGKTFTYSSQDLVRVNVFNGITINNLTFYPMIRLSSITDDTYEPYVGGTASPNPSYPQPIQVVSGNNEIGICGKNLFGLKQWLDTMEATYTENSDGSITFQAKQSMYNTTYPIKPTDRCLWSFKAKNGTGGNFRFRYVYEDGYINETAGSGTGTSEVSISTSSSTGHGNVVGIRSNWTTAGTFTGTGTQNGITATTSDGEITLNGTATANSFVDIQLVQNYTLINGETYTISLNNEEANNNVSFRITGAGTYDTIANAVNKTNTITYDSSNAIFGNKITIRTSSGTTLTNFRLKPQIEKGGKANSFTPYGTTPIELCGIGDYEDKPFKAVNGDETYDSLTDAQKEALTSGSWYKYGAIGKVVLDSSKFNEKGTTGTNAYYISTTIADGLNDNTIASSMSDKFGMVAFNNRQNGLDVTYVQNGRIYIRTKNNTSLDWSTNQNCKDWLDANTPLIRYILATPTFTELTDEDLIEQLEALKQANSYDGQTNISHQYNGSPFILDVAAVQKGTDTLVVDNEGNIYARPTLDIEGTGMVNVYLEGNQMFQVDLTDINEIVIDTDEMEAYDPSTQALMNRQVTGNYDNFKIVAGNNNLKFSGDLTKATVTGYVRWL